MKLLHELESRKLVFGIDDVVDGAADELLTAVAEHTAHLGIHPDEPLLQIHLENAHGRLDLASVPRASDLWVNI